MQLVQSYRNEDSLTYKAQAVDRLANRIRIDVLSMIYGAKSGHIGGSFSIAEILASLYLYQLKVNPRISDWADRDRLVLSKGHAAPALYAVLSEMGFFSREEFKHFRQVGSILQGHPDMNKTPGIDISTGSLGQGLSFGIGMALAGKLNNRSYHTWVIMGDGECNEGQIWEAASFAAHMKLGNITAIIDNNRYQLDGCTSEILCMEPFRKKWEAFNWKVYECNGHSSEELINSYRYAVKDMHPSLIIAHTIKGKGVSFMENTSEWHGRVPTEEEYLEALTELKCGANE